MSTAPSYWGSLPASEFAPYSLAPTQADVTLSQTTRSKVRPKQKLTLGTTARRTTGLHPRRKLATLGGPFRRRSARLQHNCETLIVQFDSHGYGNKTMTIGDTQIELSDSKCKVQMVDKGKNIHEWTFMPPTMGHITMGMSPEESKMFATSGMLSQRNFHLSCDADLLSEIA